jgi:cyclopropane fatty-acyl-phospholipid synthase-like methyltransferase
VGFEKVIPSRGITTLDAITDNLTRSTGMTVHDVQELPAHSALTLQHMRQRCAAQGDKLDLLGVDVQSRRGLYMTAVHSVLLTTSQGLLLPVLSSRLRE